MRRNSFTAICQAMAQGGTRTPRIDLHMHSTASDGDFSPHEVLQRAEKQRLYAISLTDHDTVAGCRTILAYLQAKSSPVRFIPGVELTCQFQGMEYHLLGYQPDLEHQQLNKCLIELQHARRERAFTIAELLSEEAPTLLGAVQQLPAECSLGRRHLAKLLIQQGYSSSIHGAFEHFLKRPAISAIPKARLDLCEAIKLLADAGGISSLAHPPEDISLESLHYLRSVGLNALECEYPWPGKKRRQHCRELARAAGLAISGGSDCHGAAPVARSIGHCGINLVEFQQLFSTNLTIV
ncbi:MAG: PHP domain-containing protein [Zavarzinella sp.]